MFNTHFNTPYEDKQQHIGQPFVVLGEKDPITYDYAEVGVMYRIRFPDGQEIDAYPEEVVATEVARNQHALRSRP